jgi:hypothetical protein
MINLAAAAVARSTAFASVVPSMIERRRDTPLDIPRSFPSRESFALLLLFDVAAVRVTVASANCSSSSRMAADEIMILSTAKL